MPPATRGACVPSRSAASSGAGWSRPRPRRCRRSARPSSARSSPARLIVIDEDGLRSHKFAEPQPKGCVFEYVYLARPDAVIRGRVVHEARVEMGRVLAREHPVDADLVIGVPESGVPAAVGYSQESGIPFGQGFVKNAYVGRTFIQPSQTLRRSASGLLNPLEHTIRGKRLVVVDDSIVRGNTQRAQIRMLRESGAAEVHVRIRLAAGAVAVLLRHRLRDARRGSSRPASVSRRSAPRSGRTRSATSPRRA